MMTRGLYPEQTFCRMSSNTNADGQADLPTEECWDLPADFDLYAKHEIRAVYYPKNRRNTCGHSFSLECIEPDTPLDINNQILSSRQYDSTGHCVWAGAILLIRCIQEIKKFDIGGKRMIEFGCGTGIGGLAMMLFNDMSIIPSHICFTDNDPGALNLCRRNCLLNNVSDALYSILELTWGEDDQIAEMFDVALATDVLYDVDLIKPLFKTVSRCIPSDGVFILSHIPRACYNEGKHGCFLLWLSAAEAIPKFTFIVNYESLKEIHQRRWMILRSTSLTMQ
jgi:predicted nicotinamide N-methyase